MLKSLSGRIPLLVFALLPALVGYQIFSSWQNASETARVSVQNLALVLEKDLGSDFAAIRRIGVTLAAEIAPESLHQTSVWRYNNQMTRWLRSLVPPMEIVEALRVFDANGDLLYASEKGASRVNIADNPYFQKLKSNPAIDEEYSDKIISQVTGHPLILRANAIRDAKGSFLGIVVIGVNLFVLREHFAKINVGHAGIVGLRRFDNGAIVARVPFSEELHNESVEEHPGRQAILQGERSGTHIRRSTTDGIRRIYAHRVIAQQKPFFVEVGLGESDYLAQWRQDTVLWSSASLIFMMILAVVWYRLMLTQRARLKSEQEALAIGEQLSGLYDLSPLGLSLTDQQGRFINFNGSMKNILGYSEHELKSLDYLKLPAPEYAAEVALQMDGLARTGRFGPCEMEYIRKDRSRVPVRLNGISVKASDGQPHLWTIVEDITEQKQTDKELRRSESKLRTLFESTIDAVMLLDTNGFFDCNPAALALFGCATREEFCSWHPAEVSPARQACGSDSMELANRYIATAMDKGRCVFKWVHQRADTGKSFPAEVLLSRMSLDDKPVLLAVVHDISERIKHEKQLHSHQIELEMQNAQLRQANEEIDAGKAKYFDLYDLAPVGYCTLSKNIWVFTESSG